MTDSPLHELIIADDDAGIRDMLARAFAKDFRVSAAKDGAEAIALLDRGRPAAVLVDEMMPGATGTQVLEHAKTLYPDVPRLLMTASNDTERAMGAINRGEIHRFYSKPLKVIEVRRAVLDLVERAHSEEALRTELRALRVLKETSLARGFITRVVLLGGSAERGDRVEAAARTRNFAVTRVVAGADMPAALMAQAADVVVLLRDDSIDVRALALLAHSVDEATAVVIVDGEPDVSHAVEALEVGAVDYIAAPYPDEATLARRLERAAARPRSLRDMRRLTFDLIVANRELAMARKRAEQEHLKLLNAMIRALEARDSYTAGHTDRVAGISVRCGQTLGLDVLRQENLRMGALLHDIGKIGVRDDVLLKPARLSAAEFEVIKTHTTIGASLLREIEQFQCIVPIVRGHHEKLDGSGYPDRLAGEAISLEVRIVSASDVLDALTSTRPYRRGSAPEEAFHIIDDVIGSHLDGAVVGALKQLHKEGRLTDLLQTDGDKTDGPAPYRF
ncbi:MAG: HD domain-containing protein [Deltaproteobacteria bacterium]|nr:HD domain-containing protein [Deltaproteobacteria bacterium]